MPDAVAKKMDILRVGARSDAVSRCSLYYTGAIASLLPCYLLLLLVV
jgi:hypothetical protein